MEDSVSFEPFGVFVVIFRDNKILIDRRKDDGFYLPFSLAHRGENPQECARRIIYELVREKAERVVSLPFAERIPVCLLSPSIFSSWPQGMKTFPVYAFCVNVPAVAAESGHCSWLEREECSVVLDNGMERNIFSLASQQRQLLKRVK